MFYERLMKLCKHNLKEELENERNNFIFLGCY